MTAMRTRLSLHGRWNFQQAGTKKWFPATVPGCVHSDLRANKLIPDPFWGSNERALRWIEVKDWRYRREFVVDTALLKHDHVDLVAEGLDTVATIRLNGKRIAQTENMFIGYRFDVAKAIKPGKNVIEIEFTSPMAYIRGRQRPDDAPSGMILSEGARSFAKSNVPLAGTGVHG